VENSQKIRIGFIGAGGICKSRHLPGLAKCQEAEIVAVCNRSKESSEKIAAEFGIPEIETDWLKLVERDDLDAIFIGTWPYMHKEMALATLHAGKHCFCQARMCCDLNEARQMLQAAQNTPNQVNMICPPPHRMPFEPWIKKTMAEGGIGELTFVELRSTSGANLDPNSMSWREDAAFSGLQALAMGIYAETLNAWVGPYETLAANLSTPIVTKMVDGEEVEVKVPQVLSISGQLLNGAICHEHHMGLAADTTTPINEITLFGTEGTIRHAFLSNEIYYGPKGKPLEKVDVPADLQQGWQVERDFIDAIKLAREGKPWHVSPNFVEGHQYMVKVHAVHEAARLGRSINLVTL
jgi:predicted dehydrogenase